MGESAIEAKQAGQANFIIASRSHWICWSKVPEGQNIARSGGTFKINQKAEALRI